jgi:hypothetical protein
MTAEPSQRELPYGHKVQCAESRLPGRLIVKCKYSWREILSELDSDGISDITVHGLLIRIGHSLYKNENQFQSHLSAYYLLPTTKLNF